MWRPLSKQLIRQFPRQFSTTNCNQFKVCVFGAAGGIGQPLSMLIKMNTLVSELTLYDVQNAAGTAMDISHIDTFSSTAGYKCPEQRDEALRCADIVVVPAGMPRKPGMSRDDLFESNASVGLEVAQEISKQCPKALIAVITNPVNTIVPLMAEVLKKAKVYDPKRLFGVTTLDVMRTHTFIGRYMQITPKKIKIDVIAGHSNTTIVPVISQCQPEFKGDEEDINKIMVHVQEAGTEVVKAKDGAGSATLSMACAGARFVGSLLKGLNDEYNIVECTYVESKLTKSPFFASPVMLGKDGIKKYLPLPELSACEQFKVDQAIEQLKKDIQKGIDYAKKNNK